MKSLTTLATAPDSYSKFNEGAALTQAARGKMLEDSSFF
jgi:hypothetical protein